MLKRLLNSPERITYSRLCEACARQSAEVHTKVRLADVLPIESSGISDDLYRFAMQAHYDFVITGRNHAPLFAVEFDGPSHGEHAQIDRDRKKNEISQRFHFQLFRIQVEDLYRTELRLDHLTDLIEKWFADHPEINDGAVKRQHTAVCPLCGDKMIQRRGKYGLFLGCIQYPACKGTRELPKSFLHTWGKAVAISGGVAAVFVTLVALYIGGWLWPGVYIHRPHPMTLQERQEFASHLTEADYPTCPKCGQRMALRENSKTGEPFFGCSDFPKCRATRDVEYPK